MTSWNDVTVVYFVELFNAECDYFMTTMQTITYRAINFCNKIFYLQDLLFLNPFVLSVSNEMQKLCLRFKMFHCKICILSDRNRLCFIFFVSLTLRFIIVANIKKCFFNEKQILRNIIYRWLAPPYDNDIFSQ